MNLNGMCIMALTNSLWAKVTEGIKSKNMDMATEQKSIVEDAQRQATRVRETNGQAWMPRFFVHHNDRFIPNLKYVQRKLTLARYLMHTAHLLRPNTLLPNFVKGLVLIAGICA